MLAGSRRSAGTAKIAAAPKGSAAATQVGQPDSGRVPGNSSDRCELWQAGRDDAKPTLLQFHSQNPRGSGGKALKRPNRQRSTRAGKGIQAGFFPESSAPNVYN